jgi:hypothetical protein
MCSHGLGVLCLLANNIGGILGHLDNTGLGFGTPAMLDSAFEERRVESEDFTEPSKGNLFPANEKSHELLVDVRTGGSLEHNVAVSWSAMVRL